MIWNAFANQEHGKIVGEVVAIVKEQIICLAKSVIPVFQVAYNSSGIIPLPYISPSAIRDTLGLSR